MRGSIAQWLSYLLLEPAAPVLIYCVPKKFLKENIVEVAGLINSAAKRKVDNALNTSSTGQWHARSTIKSSSNSYCSQNGHATSLNLCSQLICLCQLLERHYSSFHKKSRAMQMTTLSRKTPSFFPAEASRCRHRKISR